MPSAPLWLPVVPVLSEPSWSHSWESFLGPLLLAQRVSSCQSCSPDFSSYRVSLTPPTFLCYHNHPSRSNLTFQEQCAVSSPRPQALPRPGWDPRRGPPSCSRPCPAAVWLQQAHSARASVSPRRLHTAGAPVHTASQQTRRPVCGSCIRDPTVELTRWIGWCSETPRDPPRKPACTCADSVAFPSRVCRTLLPPPASVRAGPPGRSGERACGLDSALGGAGLHLVTKLMFSSRQELCAQR